MPFTASLFVCRKPGLTPAQFRDYWEDVHVPLVKSLVGSNLAQRIERHYFTQTEDGSGVYSPSLLVGSPSSLDFDAYAILTFEDRAAFDRLLATISQPEIAQKISEDEEKFIDREKVRLVLESETAVTHRD